MLELLQPFYLGLADFLLLFALGLLGWGLFSRLRAPVPPLLGTLAIIGLFRALAMPIPDSPQFITPAVQVILGMYIGAKITRDTVRQFKTLALPAGLISLWVLSVIFLFGWLLSRLTWLDTYTAVLSSSIGGLPEMMVLSLATGADLAVVALMQTFRMVATVAVFPLLFSRWFARDSITRPPGGEKQPQFAGSAWSEMWLYFSRRPGRLIFTLAIAALGGYAFAVLGVPAGLMVGSMLAVAVASVAGLPLRTLHPRLFNLLLVGVGIMVADNFGPEIAQTLLSGRLLWPVLLSTGFIFLGSLAMAWAIHRLAGWDLPTSFLAASPGGLTVMTTLALRYNRDPFRVSMLHLCRLMAIKSVVPLVFMFIL